LAPLQNTLNEKKPVINCEMWVDQGEKKMESEKNIDVENKASPKKKVPILGEGTTKEKLNT